MDNADREPARKPRKPSERGLAALIARVKAGDRTADDLFIRYCKRRICVSAQRQLDKRFGRRVDVDDICQLVLVEILDELRGATLKLNKSTGIRMQLLRRVKNNMIDHYRHNTAARRDIRREEACPVEELKLTTREPDPVEEAEYKDLVTVLFARLPPRVRYIARQRLTGESWEQIAADSNCSAKSVLKRAERAISQAARALGMHQLVAGIMTRMDGRRLRAQ